MKRLTNTSPFILLLVPVFMMILLTVIVSSNKTEESEMVMRPTKATSSIFKQVNSIFK
jgi:hypothetical protein